MKAKRFQIFVSVLLVTLGLSTVAGASGTNIALTVTLQLPETEIRPGVWAYKTSKMKMTQKDILLLLGSIYTLPSDSPVSLAFDKYGTFSILDENGELLDVVSHEDLAFEWLPDAAEVVSGILDTNTVDGDNYTKSSLVGLRMAIGTKEFFLVGPLKSKTTGDAAGQETVSINWTLLGDGSFDGASGNISGKLSFKRLTPSS